MCRTENTSTIRPSLLAQREPSPISHDDPIVTYLHRHLIPTPLLRPRWTWPRLGDARSSMYRSTFATTMTHINACLRHGTSTERCTATCNPTKIEIPPKRDCRWTGHWPQQQVSCTTQWHKTRRGRQIALRRSNSSLRPPRPMLPPPPT